MTIQKFRKVVNEGDELSVHLPEGPSRLPVTPLPDKYVEWIDRGRRSMYGKILEQGGDNILFFPQHLPVVVTYSKDKQFPFNCGNKGVGFIPKDEYIAEFIELFKETHERTRNKHWRESLKERIQTISEFYFDHEKIDYRAMATLEIFERTAFENLRDTPLASLLFTGFCPDYTSFQLNCAVEIVDQNDPRHTFVRLARTMFEYDDFHISQPQFQYAYLFWISEAIDKTPFRVKERSGSSEFRQVPGGMRWQEDAARAIQRAPGMIQAHIRESVEKYATARGFDEITLEVVQEAKENLMESGCPARPRAKESCPKSQPAITGYKNIYVAVDGSELSNAAMEYAVSIGKKDGSNLCGSHVYAAKLHERRFKMMEGGLPEEYRQESVLEEQRDIHDSLITQGLELITDSYLQAMSETCKQSNVPFRSVSLEGKNWRELVEDITCGRYDLIVLGGHGVGRVSRSQLGTVTERLLRRVRSDVFISNTSMNENTADHIVVCLDGSSRSWGALKRTIALAKSFQKKVVAISCFDPYFHYAMFNAISKVITDKAREVFKFEEQEKLHEDIIDSGLAKIYQSHLDIARKIGETEGVEISTHLLDGKPYAKILEFIEKNPPWLLVLGRIGVHSDEDMDIGGNTENVCRLAKCNALVVETKFTPPDELLAEATVTWTKEAVSKMDMVPTMARGVAMKAVQNHCIAKGHTVVTTSVLNDAIKQLLPPEAIERMGISFSEDDSNGSEATARLSLSFECETCGHIWHGTRPEKCPVCSSEGKAFRIIETVKSTNGVTVGALGSQRLVWEKSCLEALERVADTVLRREIRTKVEKRALTQRLSTVTLKLFEECSDLPVVTSTDATLVWTDAAVNRLERAPEGFMRKAARSTIEDYAREKGTTEITLEVAEDGLTKARGKMAATIQGDMGTVPGHPNALNDNTELRTTSGSFECGMCSYVVDGAMPEKCPSCGTSHFDSLTEERRRAVSPTATIILRWDHEALVRLERVPEGFMRLMTRCRVEQWARKHALERVTLDVIETKYRGWTDGSKGIESKMPWSDEARVRAARIPEFIRPLVMKEIERSARSSGKECVDDVVINSVMDTWSALESFHTKCTRTELS